MQVFDLIELAGYLVGFWLFVFSKKFRDAIISDFRKGSFLGKAVIVFEAVSSIFVSVILPAILVYYAIVY